MARAITLLSVGLLMLALTGCGLGRLGESVESSDAGSIGADGPTTAGSVPRSGALEEPSDRESERPDSPDWAGQILVLRDGDLHLLEGQSEHQLTDSGDYWTGFLTRGGDVIALQLVDDGGSSLVRLEVQEATVTKTPEAALSRQPSEYSSRHDYLLPSPDAEDVLIGRSVIALGSGRRIELPAKDCCASWSPDGSLVAYLTLADNREEADLSNLRYDLWVADIQAETAPRRVATNLMTWDDPYGRRGESLAWWKNGEHLLALSSDGVTVIERSASGAGITAQMNNRLVSIDVETGGVRQLANSPDLRQQMALEVPTMEDQVVITAAATPSGHEGAAFLTMDYGSTYSIGMLNGDQRLGHFITEDIPGGQQVRMGAPVWSPDGTRFAYFGWHWRPKWMALLEVFDVSTGRIERVWQSEMYKKPGHWSWSPDGEWLWITASDYGHDGNVTRTVSFVAHIGVPGHVETIHGTVLDWCCVSGGG